jgi:SAM-dependent methyltransferase
VHQTVIAVVETEPREARDWYAHALRQAIERRQPLRALVLSGRPAELAQAGVPGTCSVRVLRSGEERWLPVTFAGPQLPFQMDVFDLVVMHHWIERFDERAIANVRRCMPGGSHLLILGRSNLSISRLRRAERAAVPSTSPDWLYRRLRRMGFVVKDQRGRGLAGLDITTGRGWRRPLLACSDRFAITARRSEARHDIRLVRFSSPRTVVGSSAAWDGAKRESVV